MSPEWTFMENATMIDVINITEAITQTQEANLSPSVDFWNAKGSRHSPAIGTTKYFTSKNQPIPKDGSFAKIVTTKVRKTVWKMLRYSWHTPIALKIMTNFTYGITQVPTVARPIVV